MMGDADDSYDYRTLLVFWKSSRKDTSWSWGIALRAESNPVQCPLIINTSETRC